MQNGRTRSWRALTATAAIIAATLVFLPGTSRADPQPSIDQVQSQVDSLERQAEQATESANEIDDQLTDIQARVRALESDVTRQEKTVAALRDRVGQFAAAQYRSDGMDTTVQLLLADQPDDFLTRMSTTASLTDQQGASLTALRAQQKVLAEKQSAVEAEQARVTDAQVKARAQRKAADDKLADSRALLARLTAAERARLAAIEAAKERRQAAEAARASRDAARTADAGTSDTTTADSATTTSDAPASGRGATALAFAKAQIGKPYVFGAAGPGAYDCSGLTMAAWAAAGVSLPHSAHGQYNAVSQKVSVSDLRPGDLVMFYSGMGHVGIYAGNGLVVHAPRPGTSVELLPMKYMPIVGAVRPG